MERERKDDTHNSGKKCRRLAAPQNSQITTIVTDCGDGHKNSDVPV
jgi:hypothetical protein